MASQTANGKAFEYACLKAFYDKLNVDNNCIIIEDQPFAKAKQFYDELPDKTPYILGARATIKFLLRVEPRLSSSTQNDPITLSIQPDKAGQKGDVRDIVFVRSSDGWEIGLSCKHNHDAAKSQRLSYTIDFGQEWLNHPCSQTYFDEIKPVFERLNDLKEQNLLFEDIADKEDTIYLPLLTAFIKELKALNATFQDVPAQLLCYILGRYDFYKVSMSDKEKITKIYVFNMHKTLGKGSDVKPRVLQLPKVIEDIKFKPGSKNTAIITFDNDWRVSMRIHNAEKEVANSLKFDTKITSYPASLNVHSEAWDSEL